MSTPNYGPMQGFADTLGALPGKLDRALPTPPAWFYHMFNMTPPEGDPNPQYHAEQLDRANQSFRDQQMLHPSASQPQPKQMPRASMRSKSISELGR